MLPRKSKRVCILTAPLSYLPNAQDINFILQDIVVESNANISHSGSQISGIFPLHKAVLPFLSRRFPTLRRYDNPYFLQLLKEMIHSPFVESQDDIAIFHEL